MRGTAAARRGREIVRRSDIGSDPVIEEPLRRFLAENPELKPLDDKLHEAQAELDAGNSADAITDVGTALQLLLKHLGHHGKTLGEQIKAARDAGVFKGIDTKLGIVVEDLYEWVAAVRNQRSDGHPAAQPDPADARLVFRVVVSLALRLA